MPDYISANGFSYSEEEINDTAKQKGITFEEVVAKNG